MQPRVMCGPQELEIFLVLLLERAPALLVLAFPHRNLSFTDPQSVPIPGRLRPRFQPFVSVSPWSHSRNQPAMSRIPRISSRTQLLAPRTQLLSSRKQPLISRAQPLVSRNQPSSPRNQPSTSRNQ